MFQLILNVVRVIFLGLISFETANLFGILNYTLEFSWLGLVVTALAVWISLEIIIYYSRKKLSYTLPSLILVIPACDVFLDALGDILHWYGKFFWYDQLMHALGGATGTGIVFFISLGIVQKRQIKLPNWFLGLFSFSLANVFGILYELEEYAESLFLHNNRLGDRFDTPNDLFWNMIGSLVCLGVIYLFVRRNKQI